MESNINQGSCDSIEESLQSFYDAIKILNNYATKCDPSRFYPDLYYYSLLRYLKLIKRKARFFANPGEYKITWNVESLE